MNKNTSSDLVSNHNSYNKYKKYKTKYLNLKNIKGGNIDIPLNIINKFNTIDSYGGILITQHNKTIYEKYFNNTRESQFRIFSCTKPIAGVAIMLLIDQNKLSVNDTIDKFNINIPYADKITIMHLLNHRSGVVDVIDFIYFNRKPIELFNKIYKPNENRTEVLKFDQYIDIINKNKPLYEPGEKFQYNNTGYDILGYIIYLVSGMKTTEYIEKYIFEPLGMSDSTFHTCKLKNEVFPYETKDKIGVKEDYNFFGTNANVIATLRDYDKFMNGYKKLLTDKTMKIYGSLYYFVEWNRKHSNMKYNKNCFSHEGKGDFSHKYGNEGAGAYGLSRTFAIKFIDDDINVIIHQNYEGNVKLIDWTDKGSITRLLIDYFIGMN